MTVAARRDCAAVAAPAVPERRPFEISRARAAPYRHRGFAGVMGLALAVLLAVPAGAQQTIVIGDDKPGARTPAQGGASDIVINNDVLDSLGSPGASAPALPYSGGAVSPALPGQDTIIAPGTAGTAYRLPDTGQLVISRPSTLLFPPQQFPQSHLTVPLPEGRAAARAKLEQDLVPKPAPPVAPTAPSAPLQPVAQEPVAAAPAPTAETEPEPEPDVEPAPAPTAMPEPTPPPIAAITPSAEPIAPPPAAMSPVEPAPAAEPPTAPPLATELQSTAPASPPSSEPISEPPVAPVPAPAPAPAAVPKAAEPQSAALPPAKAVTAETRLLFGDGSAELSAKATSQLNDLARELLNNTDARVQLLAYAKASDDGSSKARRLSLSRALAVRAYLIEKGVRSTRMDVRALGSGFTDGPADRVDVLPQEIAQ